MEATPTETGVILDFTLASGADGQPGEQGPTGPTGPEGLRGPGMLIPFASSDSVVIRSSGSLPDRVYLVGFGSHTAYISLTRETTADGVNLTFSLGNYENYAFDIPIDCTLTTIVATLTNRLAFTANANSVLYPCVYAAKSSANDNYFTLLPESCTRSDTPYESGRSTPSNTPKSGRKTMNIPLLAGERIAIVATAINDGTYTGNEPITMWAAGSLLVQ